MTREQSMAPHPSDEELAAYLGGELDGGRKQRLEAHLAGCAVCRSELADAVEILRTPARGRRRILFPVAAAAAAVALLFFALPQDLPVPGGIPEHRAVSSARPPVPGAPLGGVEAVTGFQWTQVAGADRYRVTLYEDDGSVLWSGATNGPSVSLPDSVGLTQGRDYLWRVEARVGWDVWESSELVRFTLQGSVPDGQKRESSG